MACQRILMLISISFFCYTRVAFCESSTETSTLPATTTCNISWTTPAEEVVLLFTCSCDKFNDSNICVTTLPDYAPCLPLTTTDLNTTCRVQLDGTPGMTYSANTSNGTWIYKTLKPLPASNLTANGSNVTWENPESVSMAFDAISLCAVGTNGSCDNITNNTTESYTFTNLVPGASYTITAQVFSNGVGSDIINTSHTLSPSNPQNVIATRQNRSVTVSWTYPSSDVKDYFEIRCDPPTALCGGIDGLAVKVDNSQYVIPDILFGQLYKFFVRARSKDLHSEWVPSNPIFSNPGAPTGLHARITSSSETSVELRWTSPLFTHLSVYSVHVCSRRQQSCWNFNTTNVTSYTVNGLVNGETYSFTVKSRTENGTLSEDSNNESLTIEPLPANELHLLFVTSNAMGWIWRKGSGFYDGWNLFLNGTNKTVENQETLSKNYTGLNPDTSYTFSIRSFVDGTGDKIFSELRNMTSKTDEADPDPASISSLTSTNDSINIQWSEPDHPRGVIQYYVVTLFESSNSNCSSVTLINCKDRQVCFMTSYAFVALPSLDIVMQ